MVRNAKDKKRPFREGEWKGFIRAEFTQKARAIFDIWVEDHSIDSCMEQLFSLVDEGFKLSLSCDENNETYIASLTGTANAAAACIGWSLTARGRDIGRSIQALAFKHFEILQGDWSDHMANRDDEKDNKWVG